MAAKKFSSVGVQPTTGKEISAKLIHPENAPRPMLTVPKGTVADVMDSHPKKAFSPILSKPLGNMNDVAAKQYAYAESPISRTLFGIFIYVKFSQANKALAPMDVNVLASAMENSVSAVQFSKTLSGNVGTSADT